MRKRHSTRIFTDKELNADDISKITEAADLAPSSCNRKGVYPKYINFRDNKELLGGILVGGVGWIHRANLIILLVANNSAYKENLIFMKYLDAGFIAQNIWLECTDLGVGCCFVNPNVRDIHTSTLDMMFLKKDEVLCGVLAIGYMK